MGFNRCEIIYCLITCLLLVCPVVSGVVGVYEEKDYNKNEESSMISHDKAGMIMNEESELFTNHNLIIDNPARDSIIIETSGDYELDNGLCLDHMDSDLILNEIPSLNTKPITDLMYDPASERTMKRIIEPSFSSNPEYYLTSGEKYTCVSPSSTTRSARSVIDVELWNVAWEEKNSGWCSVTDPDSTDNPDDPSNWYSGNQASTGSFKVGVSTEITVTVMNNGDDTAENIPVNLSIIDFIHDQPMRRSPETMFIETLSADQTTVVTFDWTPPYASTSVRISAEVDLVGDLDTTNDALSWSGIRVCKWWDDLEGSTSGWSHTKRDDLVPSSSDDWHLTTTAFAQNSALHTQTHSWYGGNSDGLGAVFPVDSYQNDNAQSLISPSINLGSTVDTRRWYIYLGTYTSGDYEGYSAFQYHLTSVNWLMTGTTEENDLAQNMSEYMDTSDVLLTGDVSEDGGATWEKYFTGISGGRMGAVGEVQWYNTRYISVNNNAQQVYFYDGVPFNYNVTSWNNVKFRHTFKADNDSVEDIGYYLDDFIIYGNDNYTVQNRLGISRVKYPTTSGIPILYKNSPADMKVTVKNYGGLQSSTPVKMWVVDEEGDMVSGSNKQVIITNLDTDDETEVPFSWTPDDTGDYTIWFEVGDQSVDWTPSDNRESVYIHVGAEDDNSDIDILVVDDDNSAGQLGLWRLNTEDKMLHALKDIEMEYRVFTVEDNETGPAAVLMDDYELVIWLTGLDNANWSADDKWPVTLKDDDIIELKSYMDNGGKLWLISPGFIWERHGKSYTTLAPNEFGREYLRIMNCKGMITEYIDGQLNIRGTPEHLNGSDDSIMENIEYDTYATEPPWGFADIGGAIDKKDPGDDETSCLFYQDEARLNYNSLFYKGLDYMAVYFSFNFYLIKDRADQEDCVWRVLTGLEMTGGVEIQLTKSKEQIQIVSPGQEVTYQLKVFNPGKRVDTMELSVQNIYSKDYPSIYRTWKTTFEGADVKVDDQKYTVLIDGLKTKNKIYLKVTAPKTDDLSKYPSPTDWVKFKINARSKNTELENETHVLAKVPSLGNITISCNDVSKSIKVNEHVDFKLELHNETNDVSNIDVALSFLGPGENLAKFVIDGQPSTKKKIITTLEPNKINSDIELRVSAAAYTFYGFHNVTVMVTDPAGVESFGNIALSTFVEQLYSVNCFSAGDENGNLNFTIDPNHFSNEASGYITKTFPINIRNMGNGFDRVEIDWDEASGSDDTSTWPRPRIYEGSNQDINITTQIVPPYDESKTGDKFGEETVYFDVYIPLDIDIGTYIIDFVISSSGQESGIASAEADNTVSFSFEVIKPNLVFTKLDGSGEPNFQFYNSYDDLLIDEDAELGEYYVEKPEADFRNLEIEITVEILNDDISEIEFDPQALWLNITHVDKNGNIVYDINISQPISPTAPTPIGSSQKVKFKYRWIPETLPSNEPVEYTIRLTVDPNNEIFETDEADNSAEFQIMIKNIKKSEETINEDYTMLGVILMIIILVVLLIVFFFIKRKPRITKPYDENNYV